MKLTTLLRLVSRVKISWFMVPPPLCLHDLVLNLERQNLPLNFLIITVTDIQFEHSRSVGNFTIYCPVPKGFEFRADSVFAERNIRVQQRQK